MRCPECNGFNTHRRGRRNSSIRIYCGDCKRKIPINRKNEEKNDLLNEHLNRKSYRTLEDDFDSTSKTICKVVNQQTKTLIHSNDLTVLMEPQNYSGVLLIDGKYVPVKKLGEETLSMKAGEEVKGKIPRSRKRQNRRSTAKGLVILPFMDYLTHDIPVHIIASSENMYEIRAGFRQLKEMGYDLKILVCDESMGEIAQVAREFYPHVIIQTCLKHYSANVDKEFKVNGIKRSMKAIENKLKKIGESVLIPTHHYDIERARKLTNELADLEFEYGYLIKIQEIFNEIFWRVKTIEELGEAEDRLNIVISRINLRTYPHAGKIIKRYQGYYQNYAKINAHLLHPHLHPELTIPRTTNLIEGFNSTALEMRFTTIRGFEKEEYAKNYINTLILKYRFHKFKCCKKPFRHLNGKSPLEIASPSNCATLPAGKDWIEFCRKLKK
jgi:hypothetical protein